MKLSIFVFACLLASVLATPIDPNLLKSVLGGSPGTKGTTTTTPAPIESTTSVKSTDAPSTVPSETTTVKDDSTTAIVEVTTVTAQQESTDASTTVPSTSIVPSTTDVPSTTAVPSTTTVSSVKSRVSTDESKVEPAPVAVENIKKSPEARKGRGSKKFNMVEKSEVKPVEKSEEKPVEKPVEKPEEKPIEETPENKPEEKPEEVSKDEIVEEKKPEAEEEKQPEQKPKEVDEVENIPTISGKIVPAIAQPRIPSPEARSKGRKYKDIQIIQLESELEENGKYHFKYENEDGTIVHQSGEMKMMDHDGEKMMGESVEGAYSYKDDDGNTISLTYTADENGFRPIGAHIPTIPPAIARSLAWQATAKPWVDPWVVEQEELRKARKLSKKSQE